MPFSLEETIKIRQTYAGLTASEAEARLKEFGPNARPTAKKRTWLKRLWDIFSEPMMFFIILGSIVYFFMGDKHEAIILLCSIVPIGLMEFFQESRTDNAIKVLDKLIVEICQVKRDDKMQKIESRNIVPGDIVYLTAGDKVPADGYVFESSGLSIDEAILTGESFTVAKEQLPDNVKKVEDDNKLFQGTLVVQGEGYMLVESTGINTRYGKLGSLLENIEKLQTPLQKKIHGLVRQVAVVALFTAVAVTVILFFLRGWKEGVLGGITIAMSLIPEEFPVVFSVFLIMGVMRLAKQKALVREMVMVETLGSAKVICSDKTGTLTEGRMSIVKVFYKGKIFTAEQVKNKEENFQDLFISALLALEQVAVDPIEIETQNFAKHIGLDPKKIHSSHRLLADSSFDVKTKLVHHLWQDEKGKCYQYTVGAPESVINNCRLTVHEKEKINKEMEAAASEGYRLVGVAKKECAAKDEISLGEMDFQGLLIMSDPPRQGVKEAIEICQKAGIRVIMITGDNKLTAHNIAESIGLEHNEEILSADELQKMSPNALAEAVKTNSIFARVMPEQKYMIVEALQNSGEIVAMTGDGVNDAPALKKSNIGIAMGVRGTDVARAAAGIVLMDDNFSTIVNAVREGRRIYDNMRQAFSFLFSFHIPIVGLAVIPLLSGGSFVFSPIHIIFLELICDPTSVIGFEREKARRGLMEETPRSSKEPLIGGKLWRHIILRGLVVLGTTLGFYYFGLAHGGEVLARTLSFSSLIISQIFLILLSRELAQIRTNIFLLVMSALTFILFNIVLFVPAVREVFRFTILSANYYLAVVLVPFVSAAITKIVLSRFKIK